MRRDGIPSYSNGGHYEGIDETSFLGAFLKDCRDVMSKDLLDEAWTCKMPEAAASYGCALLAAADAAEKSGLVPRERSSFWAWIGLTEKFEPVAITEQLDIVRTAGRWFIFWGERGHAIRAWF